MNRQDSNTPLVSVVIPCYNCEKVIGRAVSSVLTQTYPNIKLFLVDNNSTDGTLRVLKNLEQMHLDKITVYSENKIGACAARNLGLLKSDGEWVQFLDADDELLPLKIESQMQVAATNVDIVVGDYCRIGDKGSHTSRQVIIAENDPWLGVIKSKLGVTSATLWKREKLLQVKGWNETLGSSQEYDLLFRLLKQGAKVSTSHKVHTFVYAHSESVSRTTSAKKLFQILYNRYDLRCRIYDYMHDHKLLKSGYKQHLDEYLYYHLLLISEVNMAYFKEQVRNNGFEEISLPDRLKVYVNFIRHSSKRKFGYSNKLLKLAEWQYFFCKNLHLLRV
jgi:glycosyltransferase involved in cell wall biosynthesis